MANTQGIPMLEPNSKQLAKSKRHMNDKRKFQTLTIFCVLFLISMSFVQYGEFKFEYILKNGDEVILDYSFIEKHVPELTEDKIFENIEAYFSKTINSAIFQTLNDNNFTSRHIVSYIFEIHKRRGLGYLETDPVLITDPGYLDFCPTFDHGALFTEFYKRSFKIKALRDVMFSDALNFTKRLIEVSPKDFKDKIIKDLSTLIDFTVKLKNNPNLLKSEEYKQVASNAAYLQGFIFRRLRNNDLSIDEVLSKLIHAKEVLSSTNSINEDTLVELNINSELIINFGVDGNFIIQSKKSQKQIKLLDDPKSIQYFEDENGHYYLVNFIASGLHSPQLYDASLNKIY